MLVLSLGDGEIGDCMRSLFCDHELFLFVRLTTSWKVHETWQIENDVAPM